MHEISRPPSLSARISRFEGKFAVLEAEDGLAIRWPIKFLPDEAQEGATVRLVLSTDKSEAESQQHLARAVINSLLAG